MRRPITGSPWCSPSSAQDDGARDVPSLARLLCSRLMIAAFTERAQALFRVSCRNPARGTGWLSQSEPVKRPHPTNPDLPKRIASGVALGAKIDHPFRPARFPGKHAIEPSPALGSNFSFKTALDLQL